MSHCGGEMGILAFITDPAAMRAILIRRRRPPPAARGPGIRRNVPEFSKARAERSGCFLSTPTAGVGLYLADAEGRVTDREVREIRGSFHVAAGTRIAYSNHALPAPQEPSLADEAVFFGTVEFDPAWHEVGPHALTLYVKGMPGTTAILTALALGAPSACIEGVPASVVLDSPIVAIPFVVTILPIDAAFHVLFDRMLAHGLVTVDDYVPASIEVLALPAVPRG